MLRIRRYRRGQTIFFSTLYRRLDLFNASDEVLLQLNSRDLLRLEPLRSREEAFGQPVCCGCFPVGGKKRSKPAKGDWEESWISAEDARQFHDTKPDGPSAVGLDLTFPACRGLHGLAERAFDTALADTAGGEPYRLFNADIYAYPVNHPRGLYGSVPMVLARGARQPLLACFWHNASDTFVDVHTDVRGGVVTDDEEKTSTKNVHFISECGVVDLFVMLGPATEDVYRQYAVLTGFPPLPPIFALGLHQSRYSYLSEDEVVEVDFGRQLVGITGFNIFSFA